MIADLDMMDTDESKFWDYFEVVENSHGVPEVQSGRNLQGTSAPHSLLERLGCFRLMPRCIRIQSFPGVFDLGPRALQEGGPWPAQAGAQAGAIDGGGGFIVQVGLTRCL